LGQSPPGGKGHEEQLFAGIPLFLGAAARLISGGQGTRGDRASLALMA
jgi:hypothetical protein